MKSTLGKFGFVIATLLIIVAAMLFWLSTQSRQDVYKADGDNVRKIDELGALWTTEALKVKSGQALDQQHKALLIKQTSELETALSVLVEGNGLAPKLADDVRSSVLQLEVKQEQLRRLEQNQSRYAQALDKFQQTADEVGIAAQGAGRRSLAVNVLQLVSKVNTYAKDSASTSPASVLDELESFRSQNPYLSADMEKKLTSLIGQGVSLVNLADARNSAFKPFVSSQASVNTTPVLRSLDSSQDSANRSKRFYQYGVLGALALAFLTLLALVFRPLFFTPPIKEKELTKERTEEEDSDSSYTSDTSFFAKTPTDFDEADLRPTDDFESSLLRSASTAKGSVMLHRALAGMIADDLSHTFDKTKGHVKLLRSQIESASNCLTHLQQSFKVFNTSTQPVEERIATLNVQIQNPLSMNFKHLPMMVDNLEEKFTTFTQVTRRLSEFADKKNDSDFELIQINDILDEAISMTGVDKLTRIQRDYRDLPAFFASATEFAHMFGNLLDNAANAVLRAQKSNRGFVRVQTTYEDNAIAITITDNGIGMDSEQRKKSIRLFRDHREGPLGMGLPTAIYLVKKYKGKMLFNSVLEKGTVIRVMFPNPTGKQTVKT